MQATWCKYELFFRFTAITSRERMNRKDTYYIKISDQADPAVYGIGEAGLFRGLSCDDRPGYEEMLDTVCRAIDTYLENPDLLADWPSIRFAVETAALDLRNNGHRILYPSAWTEGREPITINGLVWMGDRETMRERIARKLADCCGCVKVKIGGIEFDEEIDLLRYIRSQAPEITLRLDANGAFTPQEADEKLRRLTEFDIHSIEQPVRAGQWQEMQRLCRTSPIPIALDEELIGLNDSEEKRRMLETIRPQYIVLKPTLCGGIGGTEEWIRLAGTIGAGWWITSALESDIGLNAIAQWTATLGSDMPQGLGTGQLYDNNIPSPLSVSGDRLSYNPAGKWEIPQLAWKQF